MSALRLREAFSRLHNTSFIRHLKKGAAAALVAASVALPAAAAHNDNDDLRVHNSNTSDSREVRSLAQQFNSAARNKLFVPMDRDWIEINRALGDVRDNEQLRNRYLAEYLLRSARIHVHPDLFKDMSDAAILSSRTQVLTANGSDGSKLRVCLIYGGRGEQDIKTRVRDFIDLSRVIHGEDFNNADVKTSLTPGQFRQLINYHEFGHCMDDWYLPNMNGDFSRDPLAFFMIYHRAETFSDVYGALMMAREHGVTNAARQLADIRLANMALAGPFQVNWSDPRSLNAQASFIYATHRSLEAAQEYIDRNGAAALRGMDYNQVAALARDIVDRTALNRLEYGALMYLFATKFDMSIWDNLKDRLPYVAERHALAVELRREIGEGLCAVLDLRHIPPGQDVLSSMPFSGTPAEFMAEVKQKAGDPAALDARAAALSADLYRLAGGGRANIDTLLRVFTEKKDQWRAALANGTEAGKKEAMDNLAVAGKALWYPAHKVRGTDPHAAQDTVLAPVLKPAP